MYSLGVMNWGEVRTLLIAAIIQSTMLNYWGPSSAV